LTQQPQLFETHKEWWSGASFSECRLYRYVLWRRWEHWRGDQPQKQVMFIGLNPSTADESEDDPTIRRCIRFARDWGYSGILMMNAFAFRATQPKDMFAAADPIGPKSDDAMYYRRTQCGLIIAAWGVHCPVDRERRICEIIDGPVHCLGKTKGGRPKHPLYLRADTKPELFCNGGEVPN